MHQSSKLAGWKAFLGSSPSPFAIMKEKLRQWFYQINHAKYKHYFEEWYSNLTPQQLRWYEKIF